MEVWEMVGSWMAVAMWERLCSTNAGFFSCVFYLSGNVWLDWVLDGDLDEGEIADGPCLIGMVRSHPSIVQGRRVSGEIGLGAVFPPLTNFR